MPPRGLTNPAPKTESAREARKSFFCELCQKGYSRMNEFEAHESSYDHQHKKRLKEMKQMQRDPLASTKARRAERKADEKSGLRSITIKPLNKLDGSQQSQSGGSSSTSTTATTTSGLAGGIGAAGAGFRKGGFKKAFIAPESNDDAAVVNVEDEEERRTAGGFKKTFRVDENEDDEKKNDVRHVRIERMNGEKRRQQRQEENEEEAEESDTEDEGYEMYDPRHPTD